MVARYERDESGMRGEDNDDNDNDDDADRIGSCRERDRATTVRSPSH